MRILSKNSSSKKRAIAQISRKYCVRVLGRRSSSTAVEMSKDASFSNRDFLQQYIAAIKDADCRWCGQLSFNTRPLTGWRTSGIFFITLAFNKALGRFLFTGYLIPESETPSASSVSISLFINEEAAVIASSSDKCSFGLARP